jgi:uncharacterized membrane protein YozB (DUF420 family)
VPDKETFALINALINATTTILLLIAYGFIRRRRFAAHGWTMAAAIFCGGVFLASYLTSKVVHGELSSGIPEGWYRFTYLYIVLLPHTIMAAIVLPMIVVLVIFAAMRKWSLHRRLARWTLPIWLYVSVTGVLIYFMLYVWYPRLYPDAFRASPLFGAG